MKLFRTKDYSFRCRRCQKNVSIGYHHNQAEEFTKFSEELKESELCPSCLKWKKGIFDKLQKDNERIYRETADNLIGLGLL